MDLSIAGKRAVVAASSAGLGRAAAASLAGEGAQVVICGRDETKVARAAEAIGATGIAVDVSTVAGAQAFVDLAIRELGGIDILVTNGGGPAAGTVESTPLTAYAGALELNLTSQIAMCLAALPHMKAQRWGRIVAITSMVVRQPSPTLVLSNTARSGYTAFLKTLAREVAEFGITVNSLQPGLHDTDRLRALYGGNTEAAAAAIPAKEIGAADDFGDFVAWLCSEQARFVTGVHVPVDGGQYAGLL
jgi:3-oxoacyl-[acyl-carrier protein] reductase